MFSYIGGGAIAETDCPDTAEIYLISSKEGEHRPCLICRRSVSQRSESRLHSLGFKMTLEAIIGEQRKTLLAFTMTTAVYLLVTKLFRVLSVLMNVIRHGAGFIQGHAHMFLRLFFRDNFKFRRIVPLTVVKLK